MAVYMVAGICGYHNGTIAAAKKAAIETGKRLTAAASPCAISGAPSSAGVPAVPVRASSPELVKQLMTRPKSLHPGYRGSRF